MQLTSGESLRAHTTTFYFGICSLLTDCVVFIIAPLVRLHWNNDKRDSVHYFHLTVFAICVGAAGPCWRLKEAVLPPNVTRVAFLGRRSEFCIRLLLRWAFSFLTSGSEV